MASKGQARKPLIRPAAVTAATASEPRVLVALCRITLPMAVMEYCRPMGTPMPHRFPARCLSKAHSSLRIRRISNFFTINSRQHSPDTPWEITVAHAAPCTSQRRLTMKNRSSPILRKEDMTRKITGVLLSPSARITPEVILYRKVTGIPRKITHI